MRIVTALARRNMPGQVTIGVELLRDFAHSDPSAFHRHMWANHLAYASTFDLRRFEPGKLEASRKVLLELLCQELLGEGIEPTRNVRSLLDVGCSTGYLLRHAETTVFPSATILVGVDIDEQAVGMGSQYLRGVGSRVELTVAQMEQLDTALPGRQFDAVVCCGTLMYLDETQALRTVASLLRHANHVVGLIGLAHPHQDNRTLERSAVRGIDESWIHNFDDMVLAVGGTVRSRRWEPPRDPTDRGVYMLVAVPGRSVDLRDASGPSNTAATDDRS